MALPPIYDPVAVEPLWKELAAVGVEPLTQPEQVDAALGAGTGTVLVIVNSVCGCAAGKARPGLALALRGGRRPEHLASVFAGFDVAATDRARSYFDGFPPSSPSIALLRDGKLIAMLQRSDIETRDALSIANELAAVFEKFC